MQNRESLYSLNPSDAGIDSLILIVLNFMLKNNVSLNPSDAGIDSLILFINLKLH